MKKLLAAAFASAAIFSFLVVPVFATGSVDAQPSACGDVHGAFADQNGNFGFLGDEGGTPGYHNGAVGQEPGATGYNNSHTNCQL
jgi:hypothetical protein